MMVLGWRKNCVLLWNSNQLNSYFYFILLSISCKIIFRSLFSHLGKEVFVRNIHWDAHCISWPFYELWIWIIELYMARSCCWMSWKIRKTVLLQHVQKIGRISWNFLFFGHLRFFSKTISFSLDIHHFPWKEEKEKAKKQLCSRCSLPGYAVLEILASRHILHGCFWHTF